MRMDSLNIGIVNFTTTSENKKVHTESINLAFGNKLITTALRNTPTENTRSLRRWAITDLRLKSRLSVI